MEESRSVCSQEVYDLIYIIIYVRSLLLFCFFICFFKDANSQQKFPVVNVKERKDFFFK